MTANATATQIDVRAIAPRERHPLIFSTFGKLAEGQAFVLVNDHDPKPLHQVFEAELPGLFTWDYLEQGPDLWRVAITRLPKARSTQCCGSCGGA
jgi:uncharacterized protein (DUF2249 family)